MTPDDPRSRRSARRSSTLAEVLARRLAAVGLMWAYRWVLVALVLAIAIGLFAAWGFLLIAIAWIGGLLGLTSGDRATPFVFGATVVSGLILFRPIRWAARSLIRAEAGLDATIDRLNMPTHVAPGAVTQRRPISPTDLAALDARLASSPPSAGGQDGPEQPER